MRTLGWISLVASLGCARGHIDLEPSATATGGGTDQQQTEPVDADDDDGPFPVDDDDGDDGDIGTTGEETEDESGDATSGSPQSTGNPDPDPEPVLPVLYVNFDGVTLEGGPDDDAPTNVTAIANVVGTWEPHDPTRVVETLQRIRDAFEPYAIDVTDVRPDEGDYTMIVITDSPGPGGGIPGAGVLDCGDENPNNVAVVFRQETFDVTTTANLALFLAGISFGMNPVLSMDDAMFHWYGANEREFGDTCADEADNAACEPLADACPYGRQNSHRELLERFGAR